jgi:WD40 repeat protein
MSIVTASFSPDGQMLVTGSLSGHLVEWDGSTGAKRRVLLDPEGREDARPRIVRIENGVEVEAPFQLVRLSEHMRGSRILSTCFSPDGGRFAVGSGGGVVVVWNARSRAEVWYWINPYDPYPVNALALSPGDRWLAIGSADDAQTLRVLRFRKDGPLEATEAFTSDRHAAGVWSLCFSPDGQFLAAGGFTYSGYTGPIVYALETGSREGELLHDMTRSLAYSPDGRMIATGDDFGKVKLWDVKSHGQLFEASAHSAAVGVVLFSPDGRSLATGSRDGSVTVWDVRGRKPLVEDRRDHAVVALHFGSGDGELRIATAAEDADAPEVHAARRAC